MDDESIVTPPVEEIAEETGSVESISTEIETTPTEETVPLSVFLAAKDDKKQLKARVKELEAERETQKVAPDVESLSAKYPWVDADFLRDVALMVDKKAEEKIAPLFRQTQAERDAKKLDTLITEQLALADW
jgi:hypothetical protein